jgi:hypothetical protein
MKVLYSLCYVEAAFNSVIYKDTKSVENFISLLVGLANLASSSIF